MTKRKKQPAENEYEITYMQDRDVMEDINDILIEEVGRQGDGPGVPDEYVTQHNNNIGSRDKKRNDFEVAMKGVHDRTRVTIIEGLELKPGPVEYVTNVLAELDHIGVKITLENVRFIMVEGVGEDDDAGFTKKERQMAYKVAPGKAICNMDQGRRIKRMNKGMPAMTVVINDDGDGEAVLIHLENVLNNHQLSQRKNHIHKLKDKIEKGWMKGCGLSGFLNLEQVRRIINNNKAAC